MTKMEKSTWIGFIGGIASVGVGMALKGADPNALINPAAFLIIFAGTAAAIFNAFPMKDLKKFPKLIKIIFTGQTFTPKQEILELFVSVAKAAKQVGRDNRYRCNNPSGSPYSDWPTEISHQHHITA